MVFLSNFKCLGWLAMPNSPVDTSEELRAVASALRAWAAGQDERTRNTVSIICSNLRRIVRRPQSDALRAVTKHQIDQLARPDKETLKRQ